MEFEDGSHVFEVAEPLSEGDVSVFLREDPAFEGGSDVFEDVGTGAVLLEVEDGFDLL